MAGKPNRETTDGAHESRRAYERLDGEKNKRLSRQPSVVNGCPVQPEAILESITEGFFILDKDWRYTYINEPGAASFETTPEELIGRTIWEAIPKARDSRFHQECTRAVEQRTAVEFEEYYEPLRRWFTCRCRPAGAGLTVRANVQRAIDLPRSRPSTTPRTSGCVCSIAGCGSRGSTTVWRR